jgi:hypothetical protein
MTNRIRALAAMLALLYCLPVHSQTKAPNPDPGVTCACLAESHFFKFASNS